MNCCSNLFLLLVASWVGSGAGSRVLVVFPVPKPTHGVLGNAIVVTLLEAGYEVTYVTPFPRQLSSENLSYVDVSTTLRGYEEFQMPALIESPPVPDALHHGPIYAQTVLRHEAVRELLQDANESFDAVIADWYFSGLLAPLATLYSCPLIWYSSQELSWQQLRLMHEPSSPAYSVGLHSRSLPSTPFNMWERAKQLWLQSYINAWGYYITNYEESPAYRDIYETPLARRGRPLPDYETLLYNASLMLVNSHPLLGQRIPTPENIKLIGGHHIEQPTLQLPQKLITILDKAKHGVILISPDLLSTHKLSELKRELVNLFEQLQHTIIWQMKERLDFTPKNMHVLKSVPYLSIMDHPNTMMLITAGGTLDIIEATHAGVPIVGLPFEGNQFFNVDLAVKRGCGVRVDVTGDLTKQLYGAINDIAGNNSYHTAAKASSSIFRERQAPAAAELLHWVRLVVSTRGAPHLRSPALDLSVVERYNLDFIAVCMMLIWFLSKVVKVIRVHWAEDGHDDKKND